MKVVEMCFVVLSFEAIATGQPSSSMTQPSLDSSRPLLNTSQLVRAQTAIFKLYHRFQSGEPGIQLEMLIDKQLEDRIHRVLGYISGWAYDAKEECMDVNNAISYLFNVFLHHCAEFVNAEYDAHVTVGEIDAVATLQASEIFQILSNWRQFPLPSNQIVCFELLQFLRYHFRVVPIAQPPFLRFHLRDTMADRFYLKTSDDLTQICGNALVALCYFKPIPYKPEMNLHNELKMLMHAQNIVQDWYNRYKRQDLIFEMLDNDVWQKVQEIALKYLMETKQTGVKRHAYLTFDESRVIQLSVLQKYAQFVDAEYERHLCHPAHQIYQNSLPQNISQVKNNYFVFGTIVSRLGTAFPKNVQNSTLNSFHAHISSLPLQVVYAFRQNILTLKMIFACDNNGTSTSN